LKVPLVHKTCELYKKIYAASDKVPKKDRFGLWLKIEKLSFENIELILTAAFAARNNKPEMLNLAKIKIEILKNLFRLAQELKIIDNKKYIDLQNDLQEISRMIAGWLKYLGENNAQKT